MEDDNIKKVDNLDRQEAINDFFSLNVYAQENKFNMQFLEESKLENGNYHTNTIKIPYYDENNHLLAIKIVSKKNEMLWEKGSKTNLYGLWRIKDYDKSYIVFAKGEDMAHALWYNGIQALALPVNINFKKEYADVLNQFEKIYIHTDNSLESNNLISVICNNLPYEKLYRVNSSRVDNACINVLQLHKKGKLNLKNLIGTSEKIEENFFERSQKKSERKKDLESPEEHVQVAEKIMNAMHIRYYKQDFYVYENGVYSRNLPAIEQHILKLNKNAKKYLRTEILDFIRISKTTLKLDVDEQIINFKNGLFNLENNKFIGHSPKYFTTCQINASYIDNISSISNSYIDKFLEDISCGNKERQKLLLQIIGYAMTYKTDLQKAFLFYRT